MDKKTTSAEMDLSDPHGESLKYQLDILKMELESIDRIIARMDEITQTTKNWAVVTWTGSIGIALGSPDLRKYIILTAILPLLFWYMDAQWRRLQSRSIFRVKKIHEFLNDVRLVKSFEQKKLDNFLVYDLTGQQYRGNPDFEKQTSIVGRLKYREVMVFYWMLSITSLVLGLFLTLVE